MQKFNPQYDPMAQALWRWTQVAEINEEDNQSKILMDELEEVQENLQYVKDEEEQYKKCPVTNKDGTVFRIWVPETAFVMARVDPQNPPIIVRGGKYQEQVVFDETTGIASWEVKSKDQIQKHCRDLESSLKTAKAKENLIQKEKDLKEEIKLRQEKLKELRKAHEEILQEEQAEMLAATEEEAKTAAKSKQKMSASLDKVAKLLKEMTLEGKTAKDKRQMAKLERVIEETKEAIAETPGSSSSSGAMGPEVKKTKTKNKWAKQVAAQLVMKRALKSKAAKTMKKAKNDTK